MARLATNWSKPLLRTRHRRTAVDLTEVERENLISDLPTKERQLLGNTARK
jgi:hypothetical protein